MGVRGVLLCACLLLRANPGLAAQSPALGDPPAGQASAGAQEDGVTRLVRAIEESIRDGDGATLRALARPEMNRVRLSEFALSHDADEGVADGAQGAIARRSSTAASACCSRSWPSPATRAACGRGGSTRCRASPAIPGLIADIERLTVIRASSACRSTPAPSGSAERRDQRAGSDDDDRDGYAFAARVPTADRDGHRRPRAHGSRPRPSRARAGADFLRG